MNTEILLTSDLNAISRALSVLQAGGLVAFPTDTVYGLAAATFSSAAIDKLFAAKTRETAKAIAVLIGDLYQLDLISSGLTPSARKLAAHFWPGALTLVVPKHPILPVNISPYPSVGVRMPNHAFAIELIRRVGPLATTSANISGGANASSPIEVLAQLAGRIDLLLDGGTCPGGVPSTVIDCTQDPPVVLRPGAVSEADIRLVLNL